ncbi:hypothetical protein FHX52_0488 [Humibacillus xanthopallidus]|uniref:N-acetyltransferase domain-containing protein n=1 Tax=Humibacillus xanthopallidus TaxID=412689 RepID=A0A543PTK0_9MICO|nr:hypothetical protein [Humibacillus xanthopallidus]TQN47394.1 hypothetical protein FHX52_0488 [Humibacillus xanthopallidus]
MTSTPDRIALAARNNALWCDAVARSHGVRGTFDDEAWAAPTRTPPFYPDAVTLSPTAEEYDLLARIDDSDGCSVKDSWARLDLTLEDFARLVVGEWVWLDPSTPLPEQTPGSSRTWRRVRGADELAQWVQAWSSDPDAAAILRPSLLDEPGVHVLAARSETDAVVAGAILHVTGEVAGLGNVFARDGDVNRAWREAAAAVREVAPGIPLVGWEAGATVDAAVAAGCERLGPLTVWLK